jgi:hypothetical protein
VFDSECSGSRLPKSNKAQFTIVNEHLFDDDNDEIGHYGQTLNNSENTHNKTY